MNVARTGPRGGTPVVLIHAAGLDLTYWDVEIAALSVDRDVIAFDLPRHGRSPGTAETGVWTVSAQSPGRSAPRSVSSGSISSGSPSAA